MTAYLHRREVLVGGSGFIAAGLASRSRLAIAAEPCGVGECADVLAAYRITVPDGARDMQPASLSHAFAPGEVPKGFHAKPSLAVQMPLLAWEVRADTYPDGSWKTADYRFELPRLEPGDSIVVELRRQAGAPATQPVDPVGLHGAGASAAIVPVALVGYVPPDNGAEAAYALKPGDWSGNLQRNNYRDCNPSTEGVADYWFLSDSPSRAVANSYSRNFAFGSGVWMPDRLRFVLSGGGHGDWAGSEILAFDLPSLRWVRTDDSCRYCGDETWDGTTNLNQWNSPCLDRDSKVAKVFIPSARSAERGQIPWYPWPNIRGRRAPVSSHTYGYMAYDKAHRRVWYFGTSLWPGSGGYNGGLWAIDAETLTWDEANTVVLPPEAGPGYGGTMRSVSDDRVLLHTGGSRRLRLIDFRTGRVANTTNPRGKYQVDDLFIAEDPDDPGHKAAYFSLSKVGEGFSKMPRCNLMPGEPGFLRRTTVLFRNQRPPAVDERACPVVMGDYGRNPRQVVFFSPRTTDRKGGLAVYDTERRSWTDIPVTIPKVGTHAIYQGFAYIPAYDCFALCTRDADARGRSVVLLLKRPPQVD